jgi:hypothetical protein
VKTGPKRSFSVIENERIGVVFTKTGSIISDTAVSKNFDILKKFDKFDVYHLKSSMLALWL